MKAEELFTQDHNLTSIRITQPLPSSAPFASVFANNLILPITYWIFYTISNDFLWCVVRIWRGIPTSSLETRVRFKESTGYVCSPPHLDQFQGPLSFLSDTNRYRWSSDRKVKECSPHLQRLELYFLAPISIPYAWCLIKVKWVIPVVNSAAWHGDVGKGGSVSPSILSLDARWRWVFNFTRWPLHITEQTTKFTLYRRLGWASQPN